VLPLSIGDGDLAETAVSVVSVPEIFGYWLQGGRIDVGFLSAAQIDRFGNLNTTIVGSDYHRPKVRLPGSGGAAEIAWLAKKTVILLPQKRNKFPEKLDFRTSVGHLEGGRSREELGAPGKGPERVITNLGVYGFDGESREMVLEAVHPGIRVEEVRAEVSWPLRVREPLATTALPDAAALRLLREELDPKRIYLG
jgi:glutaconate CoA-transferase subunit B